MRETNPTTICGSFCWSQVLPSSSLHGLASFYHPSFWASLFQPCLEPGEGDRWKQTTARPGTRKCCTLAPLLAGANSALRTAEKATVCLSLIYIFIQPCHYHKNGFWLPYLWALTQGLYLLFEAQTAYKGQATWWPWCCPADGGRWTFTSCLHELFSLHNKHCTINLKRGAFNFVWQTLKSIQSKELWGGSADTLISYSGSSCSSWAVLQYHNWKGCPGSG